MRLMGLKCNLLSVYLDRRQHFNYQGQTSSPQLLHFSGRKRMLILSAMYWKISGSTGQSHWKDVLWVSLNNMKAICSHGHGPRGRENTSSSMARTQSGDGRASMTSPLPASPVQRAAEACHSLEDFTRVADQKIKG